MLVGTVGLAHQPAARAATAAQAWLELEGAVREELAARWPRPAAACQPPAFPAQASAVSVLPASRSLVCTQTGTFGACVCASPTADAGDAGGAGGNGLGGTAGRGDAETVDAPGGQPASLQAPALELSPAATDKLTVDRHFQPPIRPEPPLHSLRFPQLDRPLPVGRSQVAAEHRANVASP